MHKEHECTGNVTSWAGRNRQHRPANCRSLADLHITQAVWQVLGTPTQPLSRLLSQQTPSGLPLEIAWQESSCLHTRLLWPHSCKLQGLVSREWAESCVWRRMRRGLQPGTCSSLGPKLHTGDLIAEGLKSDASVLQHGSWDGITGPVSQLVMACSLPCVGQGQQDVEQATCQSPALAV